MHFALDGFKPSSFASADLRGLLRNQQAELHQVRFPEVAHGE
jgi:hypothetical protein